MESAPFEPGLSDKHHLLVPDPHQPLAVSFSVVTDQTVLLDRGRPDTSEPFPDFAAAAPRVQTRGVEH